MLYYADLNGGEGLPAGQRGLLLRRLADSSFVPEVRAEGIALLDPSGETVTDLGMPEEGTDGHATLLVAEYLAAARGSGQAR